MVQLIVETDYYVYSDQGAASPAVQSANDFDGIFIGVSSGINFPKNYNESNNESIPTPIQVPLQISAGYSHVWDTFYLGTQANFGWNFVPSKTGYQGSNSKDLDFDNKWQTMATVQIGGVISNTSVMVKSVVLLVALTTLILLVHSVVSSGWVCDWCWCKHAIN